MPKRYIRPMSNTENGGSSEARRKQLLFRCRRRGFKESPAFRVPHSDQYSLIERIRRIRDGSLLEIDVSIEDPIAYTQPLKGRFYFKKDPTLEITEYNCDGMFDYRPYSPKK